MVGESVQGYRILRALGSGAIGVVYVGEHEKMGRKAAVKLLRPELSSNTELVNRFFDEARAATLIEHRGVVQVFDCGTYAPTGQAFIIMELLDGESLRDCNAFAGEQLQYVGLSLSSQRGRSDVLRDADQHIRRSPPG